MAYIKINTNYPVYDGMPLTFEAPCDCTSVEGLTVTYNNESTSFVFKDAHGNTLTGVGGLFAKGAYVKVILDTQNGGAYIQNADTNAYLEAKFNQTVTTTGNGSAYVATVQGISELKAGVSFVMIPHTTSISISPTLDVNGLGAANIKRLVGSFDGSVASGYKAGWLGAGVPIRLVYDGRYWLVEGAMKPYADDLQGILSVTRGGTGYTTVSDFITQNKISKSQTGSYEGSGFYGGTISLSFSFVPKCVIVQAVGASDNTSGTDTSGNTLIWVNGSGFALAIIPDGTSEYHPLAAWKATLSSTSLTITAGGTEFNASGQTYNYIAFA